MIPVEQRFLAIFDEHGDNVQRGDCLSACIAALFELPIDDVPFFVDMENWWGEYNNWLVDRGLQLAQVRIVPDEDDQTRLAGGPIDGIYWIATVKSPRGKTRCSVCKGRAPGARAVARRRGAVRQVRDCAAVRELRRDGPNAVSACRRDVRPRGVWDPHPRRDMGHLGFVSGEWFVVRDPARLVRA